MKLEVTGKETFLILNALDFYSRIWIGQYGEIDNILRFYDYENRKNLEEKCCEEAYLELRQLLIPELAGESFFCSLGIWNVHTNHQAKAAYDMQQIIRYTQAWYMHPEGGMSVDFGTPILEGDLPQIQCICQGEATNCKVIISGDESNYHLLIESLEVYGSLFECKFEELFRHYTDDAEALQAARKIETVYAKSCGVGSVKLQNICIEIEKLKSVINGRQEQTA